MDEKDKRIEELEQQLASYKDFHSLPNEESIKLFDATGELMRFSVELFNGFQELLEVFGNLSKRAGDSTLIINKHFIDYKEGAVFDPDFVRVEIAKLVDGISAETSAMSKIYERVKSSVDKYSPAFDEAKSIVDKASKNDV